MFSSTRDVHLYSAACQHSSRQDSAQCDPSARIGPHVLGRMPQLAAGRTFALGAALQRAKASAAPWLCCTLCLLLARRCGAALRRSWIRREVRQTMLVLRRLQEMAGACAAVERHKTARRALAVAGAARELIDDGLLRMLDPSRPAEGGSLRTLRARAARVELEARRAWLARRKPRRPCAGRWIATSSCSTSSARSPASAAGRARPAPARAGAAAPPRERPGLPGRAAARAAGRPRAERLLARQLRYGSTPLGAWLAVFGCDATR